MNANYYKSRLIELLLNEDGIRDALKNEIINLKGVIDSPSEQRDEAVKENLELRYVVKYLYKGLDELYLSGLSEKQIAVIEQLQNKADPFVEMER